MPKNKLRDAISNYAGLKLLVFDIETTILKAYTFRPGNQYVHHKSLCEEQREYDIISICYIDSVTRKSKVLHWGFGAESSNGMMKEFDKVIKHYQDQGYLIFGKNNNNFDNKHINTLRFMNGNDPMPEWTKYVADMEVHFRSNFYFPSQSLDYISKSRGLGGKDKMEQSDWIEICDAKRAHKMIASVDAKYRDAYNIVATVSNTVFGKSLKEVLSKGKIALQKMIDYNEKDCLDTLQLFEDAIPYLSNFKNLAMTTRTVDENILHGTLACKNCGSDNLKKNGIRGNHQHWSCLDCPRTSNGSERYAGRSLITAKGKLNSIKP